MSVKYITRGKNRNNRYIKTCFGVSMVVGNNRITTEKYIN